MNHVVGFLNEQVADWNLLFVKLHNFHWNVKGPDFFTLHEKFEELYDEAAGYIDEIAERVLALGGVPAGSLKEYLALTTLQEATGKETPREMTEAVVADLKATVANLKRGLDLADEAGDVTTDDLLTGIHSALEKHIWLLSAFLG